MERLTYWNEEYGCWSYQGPSGEAAKHLAAYENAEEQGLLVRLPCKVGDTVYIADYWGKKVQSFNVNWMTLTYDGMYCWEHRDEQPITPDIWGKTVFLTKEAAEQALREREVRTNV